MKLWYWFGFLGLLGFGCTSGPAVKTIESLDVDRFMGDWYVHGVIPTSFEEGWTHGVENYKRIDDQYIAVSYRHRKPDGEPGLMTQTARIEDDPSQAFWKIKPISWLPIWFDYYIIHLDADYQETMVTTADKTNLWYMHRQASLSELQWQSFLSKAENLGFTKDSIQRVKQD